MAQAMRQVMAHRPMTHRRGGASISGGGHGAQTEDCSMAHRGHDAQTESGHDVRSWRTDSSLRTAPAQDGSMRIAIVDKRFVRKFEE